ncbi:L,D-transpeptidase [Nocardia sp. NPDC049220]|uniref:L,D-transpeptidase n=1 Tax=Nocardia sp. NPDC049220 TaxID=3155273 RepID=UPI0033F154DD
MSRPRLRNWTARWAILLGVMAAGLAMAVPAQAEPLWPGGPDIPGMPALIPPPAPPPPTAPCSTAARACLRLSTDDAWLMDEGRVVYGPTPISHGMPGYETPPGVFRVSFKKEFHWSTMHNAPMPYAVFFNGDIAFHVGPIEQKSHGCVRMLHEAAKEFYEYLWPGDIVEVVK